MPLITSISDEILALETGSVLTRGKPQEVLMPIRWCWPRTTTWCAKASAG